MMKEASAIIATLKMTILCSSGVWICSLCMSLNSILYSSSFLYIYTQLMFFFSLLLFSMCCQCGHWWSSHHIGKSYTCNHYQTASPCLRCLYEGIHNGMNDLYSRKWPEVCRLPKGLCNQWRIWKGCLAGTCLISGSAFHGEAVTKKSSEMHRVRSPLSFHILTDHRSHFIFITRGRRDRRKDNSPQSNSVSQQYGRRMCVNKSWSGCKYELLIIHG